MAAVVAVFFLAPNINAVGHWYAPMPFAHGNSVRGIA